MDLDGPSTATASSSRRGALGDRSGAAAPAFTDDPRARPAHRVRLATDGHEAYLEAVEGAFGGDGDIDCAMPVKLHGEPAAEKGSERRCSPAECTGAIERRVEGNPDPAAVGTSHVERRNLATRMGMRRFTRPTNAFSKRLESHAHMVALYAVHCNFVRLHESLRVTPAMAAGVSGTLRDMAWIVGLVDARAVKPQRPGPRPGTLHAPRKSNRDTTRTASVCR